MQNIYIRTRKRQVPCHTHSDTPNTYNLSNRLPVPRSRAAANVQRSTSMPRDRDVLCIHCQQYMSRSRERAHRVKHHAPLYSPPPRLPSKLRRVVDIEPEPADEDTQTVNDTSMDSEVAAINYTEQIIREKWTYNLTLTDSDASDTESVDADGHDNDDSINWNKFEDTDFGLTAWDQLGEGYERDAVRICTSSTSSSFVCRSVISNKQPPSQPMDSVTMTSPSVVLFRTKSRPIQVMKTLPKSHLRSRAKPHCRHSTDCAPALPFWRVSSPNSTTAVPTRVSATLGLM